MKVSEAIDQLKVGDTVWVKGKAEYIGKSGALPLALEFSEMTKYFVEADEISLTEPTKEVKIPECVAEFYEANKDDLNFAIYEAVAHSIKECGYKAYPEGFMDWLIQSSNNPFETLIRMKDGYTVKPKRWVVKNEKGYVAMENFKDFDNHKIGVKFTIVSEKSEAAYWDDIDYAKAEAVAILVEGSVEEVAD